VASVVQPSLAESRRHEEVFPLVVIREGVPTPTAMAIMGWSSAEMAKRYQHMSDVIRSDVAERVAGLLWEPAGDQDDDSEGSPGAA
jgi:hypothetical protein